MRVPGFSPRELLTKLGQTTSLEETIDQDQSFTLGDLLLVDEAPSAEERVLMRQRKKFLNLALKDLDKQNKRLRPIAVMRFGLDGEEPLTLEAVGRRMGVSRERIRQLELDLFTGLLESSNFTRFLKTFGITPALVLKKLGIS